MTESVMMMSDERLAVLRESIKSDDISEVRIAARELANETDRLRKRLREIGAAVKNELERAERLFT